MDLLNLALASGNSGAENPGFLRSKANCCEFRQQAYL